MNDRKVSVGRLNARRGPGITYGRVTSFPKGTVLNDVEERGSWFATEAESGHVLWLYRPYTVPAYYSDDPFEWMAWPTEHMKVTQDFGANPQNYARFGLPGHEGIDFRAPMGSNIYAIAPGTVTYVRRIPVGSNYGIHVRIDHGKGYHATYAHFSEALVDVGQFVDAGQVIGKSGNTGNSFGAHLHLTLKHVGYGEEGYPGDIIDPTKYMQGFLDIYNA